MCKTTWLAIWLIEITEDSINCRTKNDRIMELKDEYTLPRDWNILPARGLESHSEDQSMYSDNQEAC